MQLGNAHRQISDPKGETSDLRDPMPRCQGFTSQTLVFSITDMVYYHSLPFQICVLHCEIPLNEFHHSDHHLNNTNNIWFIMFLHVRVYMLFSPLKTWCFNSTADLPGFSWAKLYLQNLAIFRANAGEYANIAYDFGM